MSGINSTISSGNVASGATDNGNPVKIGGRYNASMPTLTDGQRGDMQLDANGNNRAKMVLTTQVGADGFSNSTGLGFATPVAQQTGSTLMLASAEWYFNGVTFDRMRGDVNGMATQSGLSATFWNYAPPANGIVNSTTAVTIKAAAGASVRNYLKSIEVFADALGAATELAIRDGAGGTVLWRGKISTAGITNGLAINFDPPLKGTANTLMEVVTLTASVTGGVFVNAQGYTGA